MEFFGAFGTGFADSIPPIRGVFSFYIKCPDYVGKPGGGAKTIGTPISNWPVY